MHLNSSLHIHVYMMLCTEEETEQFHFCEKGSIKDRKSVFLILRGEELEVKSSLFLGPVHRKTGTVIEKHWGQVGKSVQRRMNIGVIKISLYVSSPSQFLPFVGLISIYFEFGEITF